jgi:hypothetical protein
MSKSSISKLAAFSAYLDMGEARSMAGLERLLNGQGFNVARTTLIKWRNDGEWDKKIPEVEAARELEAESAKVAIAARQFLDETAEAATGENARSGDAGGPIEPSSQMARANLQAPIVPFSPHEKLESTAESLAAMVSALAQTVTAHVAKIRDPAQVALDVPELLQIAKATGDVARAAGDLHKALNPNPIAGKGKPIEPDAPTMLEATALPAGSCVPTDADNILAKLRNPPRLRQ